MPRRQVISSASSESRAITSRSVDVGIAPDDELVVDEADRVAGAEAPAGVVAGRARDRSGAHRREDLVHRLRVLGGVRAGDRAPTAAASPACSEREGTTTTFLSDSSAARSAAMNTFELLGSSTTSSAGTEWIAASSSLVDGLSVEPPSSALTPRPSEQLAEALAGDDGERAADGALADLGAEHRAWHRQPRVAVPDLLAHVGDVDVRDVVPAANSAIAASGESVWTWILSVERSPTTSTESPSCSSCIDVGALVEVACRSRQSWCSSGRSSTRARDA